MRPAFCTARIELRQLLLDLVGAEAADEGEPSGLVLRVEDIDQAQQLVGLERRPALHADRIDDAAAELHVRAVRLARAVADPQEVAGGRHVLARAHGLVLAGQRLLVGQQQGLVAGVEAGGAHLQVLLGGHAEQRVDLHRALDLVGERVVARLDRGALHELQLPAVRILERGIAAVEQRAQEIQGRRRLAVGVELPARIGNARLRP